jgi:SpoVK/Ycf46/Vps4 family AAA+-type ATPase
VSEVFLSFYSFSIKNIMYQTVRARSAAPCILFFDEFDAIAHRRSFGDANDSAGGGGGGGGGGGEDDSNAGGGGGVYGRLLSTFLNEMDGVGGQQQDVLVMAATNRKEVLDPALVRPGRIDKTFELTFPTKKDLEAICKYYMNKMPLGSDVDVKTLVHRFTG